MVHKNLMSERVIFRTTIRERKLAEQAAKQAKEANLSAWLRSLVKRELSSQGLLTEKVEAKK